MAHEWFYGLVGNNQATEPWLDEAFATYGEAIANDADYSDSLDNDGDVNRPMTYWDKHSRTYGAIVYAKGAAALLEARDTDPRGFDTAIRCYVNAHAYGIATGRDLAAALASLPEALTILRRAGAID
jgi:aminopeptidase N